MGEGGPPQRSGVRVTGRAESTGVADQLDPGYFCTLPGVLKILQMVLGAVCLGCGSPAVTPYARFFLLVAGSWFALTLVFCLVYFFGLKRVWPTLPWLLAELCCACVGGILLLASSLALLAASSAPATRIALAHHGFYGPYVAAGCFGLLDCGAHSAAAFFLFMERRASSPAAPRVA